MNNEAYDVFKAFINEHSITIGHVIGKHHLVTFSLGSKRQDGVSIMMNLNIGIRIGK